MCTEMFNKRMQNDKELFNGYGVSICKMKNIW